jgi:Mn-containing catalase
MNAKSYSDENKEKILEPFRIALKIEREGKKFLLEAAESSEHPAAKRTFEYLASQEDNHAEKIQKMYQAISDTGESIPMEEDDETPEEKLVGFNRRLAELKGEMRASAGDIEAYKTALEMEQDTEEFYRQKIKDTDDPNIKQIYEYFINEESAHSVMLRSCLEFMEDPASWFKNQE